MELDIYHDPRCPSATTELGKFVRIRPEVQAIQLTDNEWSTLQQVTKILKPFWDHKNSVSMACPTIVESLPIHWSLDDLLNDVQNAEGVFETSTLKFAMRWKEAFGIWKMNKFARKLDDNLLYGSAQQNVFGCVSGSCCPLQFTLALWVSLDGLSE